MKKYTVSAIDGNASVNSSGKNTLIKSGDILSPDALLLSPDGAKLTLSFGSQQVQVNIQGEVLLSELQLTVVDEGDIGYGIERVSSNPVDSDSELENESNESKNYRITRGNHHAAAEVVERTNLNIDVEANIVSRNRYSTLSVKDIENSDSDINTDIALSSIIGRSIRNIPFTSRPVLIIDSITSNNIINKADSNSPVQIHAHVSNNVPAGTAVTISVGGKHYSASVGIGGIIVGSVPGSIMKTATHVDVKYAITDSTGHKTTIHAGKDYLVDITPPKITINPVTIGTDLVISGKTDAEAGQKVAIDLNGKNYVAIVTNGAFSFKVPATDTASFKSGSHLTITAEVTDIADNVSIAKGSVNINGNKFSVGKTLIEINDGNIADGDNILNKAEAKAAEIKGNIGAGSSLDSLIVTDIHGGKVVIPASSYKVNPDGSYATHSDLSSLADGKLTATMQGHDKSGKAFTSTDTISKDTVATAVITIEAITGDDIVSIAESLKQIPLGGTVGGDIKTGDKITISIDGKNISPASCYMIGGRWYATVNGVDIKNGHKLSVEIKSIDSVGNSVVAHADRPYSVDLTPPTATLDTIGYNNLIGVSGHKKNLIITGNAKGSEDGSKVTIEMEGKLFTGLVKSGKFSVTIPSKSVVLLSEGKHSITTITYDKAGNASLPVKTNIGVDLSIKAADDNITTDEDHKGTIIGNVITNDDHNHGEKVKAVTSLKTAHGVFTLIADGEYTFIVNTAASQYLNRGDKVTDTLTYELTDLAGNTKTAILSAEITGSDDVKLTGKITGSIKEDANILTLSGDVTMTYGIKVVSMVDHVYKGAYGTLDFRATGHWVYTLNNADASVQGLKGGEVVHDKIEVAASDGRKFFINIEVSGTRDYPKLSVSGAPAKNIDSVTQHNNFDATLDLGLFNAKATGVPKGITIAHMYQPGSSVDLMASVPVADRAVMSASYTASGVSGFSVLTTPEWFSTHLGASGIDFTKVTPNVKNAMNGGIVEFSDGSIAVLEKVSNGISPIKSSIYYKILDHSKAHDGYSVITGEAKAGESVKLYEGAKLLGVVTADANGHWKLAVQAKLIDGSHALHTDIGGKISATQNFDIKGLAVTEPNLALHLGTISEGGPITSLSGKLQIEVKEVGDNPTIATQVNHVGSYGKFSVDAKGKWHYSLDHSKAQSLNVGQTEKDTFQIKITTKSGNNVTKDVVVDITGTNDIPIVSAPIVLAKGTEDTPITITAAQLLAHASDVDANDKLSIKGKVTADHGIVTGPDATGNYQFKPAANYNGAVKFSYDITDSHGGVVHTSATTSLESVADAATVSLSASVEEKIITLPVNGTGSIMNTGILYTGGKIDHLAVEFSVIGGNSVASSNSSKSTFISYATSRSVDEFFAKDPANLTVQFGGKEYKTGINTTADSDTHRYSILWNGKTGHLDVLVDGAVKFSKDGVAKGVKIPGDGILALGQSQSTFNIEDGTGKAHGFTPNKAFHGQILNAALANAQVTPAMLKDTPLASTLSNKNGLVINIQASSSSTAPFEDTTGNHHIYKAGSVTSASVLVDSSLVITDPGSLVHLKIKAQESGDKITKEEISGIIKDTVISDGTHTHKITGISDKLDITGWAQGLITAQLPANITQNMNINFVATTTGPYGKTAIASSHLPLMLDPGAPIPNAKISGDDNKTTDDSTAVSGVLHITDSDPSQAHFIAKAYNSTYGKLNIKANGDWTFTPNVKANALNDGVLKDEVFRVKSADGTPHEITIHLTGTNAAPVLSSAVILAAGTEDTDLTFTVTQLLANATDVDENDKVSIKGKITADHGTVIGPDASGNYTFTPVANYNGAVSFTYDITDTHGGILHAKASTTLASVLDAVTVTVSAQTGAEDTAIPLNIKVISNGETVDHYTILGVPAGAKLSAGADNGKGEWIINNASVAGLTITPVANFAGDMSLTVKAATTDGTITKNSTSQVMSVHVNPVADTPKIDLISVNATSAAHGPKVTDLDYSITLTPRLITIFNAYANGNAYPNINMAALSFSGAFNLNAVDSITFNGNPVNTMFGSQYHDEALMCNAILDNGHSFHHGTRGRPPAPEFKVGDTIEIHLAQGVTGTNGTVRIKIFSKFSYDKVEDNYNVGDPIPDESFQRDIEFTETIISNLTQHSLAKPLAVDEDGQFDLSIDVSTPDTDGSETLNVHVEGLPKGATLNHGAPQSDGSYILTPAELKGLQVVLPKNYHGVVDLDVSAISHDGISTQTSAKKHLHIGVKSIVDLALVTAGNTIITEHEDWAALALTANATDPQDPITNITIKGISTKSELRLDPSFHGIAPVHNTNGTWTIDPASVTHLQIHTHETAGNRENFSVIVETSDSAGTTKTTTKLGHFISKAVIDGSFIFSHPTGAVKNIGELISYKASTDKDERAYVVVEAKPGVAILVDDAGTVIKATVYSHRAGGPIEHYQIAIADLAHTHIHSAKGSSSLDIHVAGHIEEGVLGSGLQGISDVEKDFTNLKAPSTAHLTIELDILSNTGTQGDTLTQNRQPTFVGSGGTPGDKIHIKDTLSSKEIAVGKIKVDGTYSVKAPWDLDGGEYELTAETKSPAGAVTMTSGSKPLHIDILHITYSKSFDTVEHELDEICNSQRYNKIHGKGAPPGSSFAINLHPGQKPWHLPDATGIVKADGTFEKEFRIIKLLSFNNKKHSFTNFDIEFKDAQGAIITKDTFRMEYDNTNPISDVDDVTIVLDDGSDTGLDLRDNITKNNTPVVAGLAGKPNAVVDIIENGKIIATTTADDAAFYTVVVPTLSDGTHSLIAKATVAGVSIVSATSLDVTIDTVADAPTITIAPAIAGNVYSGSEVGADGTITAKIGFSNTVSSGDILTINGKDHILTDADLVKGSLSQEVIPGSTVTASISDTAGNISHEAIVAVNPAIASASNVNLLLDSADPSKHNVNVPSLDNINHHLEAARNGDVTSPHNALASAAHLLRDMPNNSIESRVITNVENLEAGSHAKNPNAPAAGSSGSHPHDAASLPIDHPSFAHSNNHLNNHDEHHESMDNV